MNADSPKQAVIETPQFIFKKDPADRTQDYDKGLYPGAPDLKVAKKTGWLKKQGGAIKTWKRRWCAADAGYFFYFKTDADPKPQGLFRLLDYQNVERADTKIKKKNALTIFNKGSADRCYYMISDVSEDDINSWVKALRTEIKFVVDFVDAKSNLTHVTKERPKGPSKRPPTRVGGLRVTSDESLKSPTLAKSESAKKETKAAEEPKKEIKKEDPKKQVVPPRPTAAKPKRKSIEDTRVDDDMTKDEIMSTSPNTSSPIASSPIATSPMSAIDEDPDQIPVVSIIEEAEDDAYEEIQEAKEEVTRLQKAAEEKFEESRLLTETLQTNLDMLNTFYKDLKDSIDSHAPPEELLAKVQKHRDTVVKFLEQAPKIKSKQDESASPTNTTTTKK